MIQIRATANRTTPTNSLIRREVFDSFTSLDLHDDGQHERSPARAFAEEPAQLHAQFFLDESRIRPLFEARAIDRLRQEPRSVGEQLFGVFHDESARDD